MVAIRRPAGRSKLRIGKRSRPACRYMLFADRGRVLTGLVIHEAARELEAAGPAGFLHGADMSGMSAGFLQSVSCAERWP